MFLWDLIANHGSATIGQKNAIMDTVRAAMIATPKDQATRDLALRNAVFNNGNHIDLAKTLKRRADLDDPITPLRGKAQSGLEQGIYTIITALNSAVTTVEMNNIMDAVKATLAISPITKAARNKAIEDAIAANGNFTGLANLLKTRINMLYRIP